MSEIIVIASFSFFGFFILKTFIDLKFIKKIDISGKAPVKEVLYRIGKIFVLISFIFMIISSLGRLSNKFELSLFLINFHIPLIGSLMFLSGVIIIFVSYLELGSNLKLGLPKDNDKYKVTLKTSGIYKFSRNPIYIAFNLMCIGSSIYVFHPINIIATVIAIFVHHKQILAEEEFLFNTFGDKWISYSKKVKRYI